MLRLFVSRCTTISFPRPAAVRLLSTTTAEVESAPSGWTGGLSLAEQSRCILQACHRGQLTTAPRDISADPSHHPPVRSSLVSISSIGATVFLNVPKKDEHVKNLEETSIASLMLGHTDPVRLVNSFRKVSTLPPRILLTGLILKEKEQLLNNEFVSFRMLPESVTFVSIFAEKSTVSIEDFRGAYVDPFALDQFSILDQVNTEFYDILPGFCVAYIGIQVTDAFIYCVDRLGFNIFAKKAEADDEWSTFRFAFSKSVEDRENLMIQLKEMKTEAESSLKV